MVAKTKAELAEGRIIHGTIDFTLTPPQGGELGEVDAAVAIGRGLAREAAQLLHRAAELEGFTVEINYKSVVY